MSTGGDERFYVRSAGRVTGPFALSRLVELKRLGRLPGFCELSRDRIKWEPAAAVMGGDQPQPVAATATAASSAGPAVPGGPPAAESWYYTDAAGTRIGPVARAQVLALAGAGVADDQTLVWKDGMADWQPYFSVFGANAAGGSSGGTGRHGLAEVGGLLLMIAAWLWTAALAALCLAWAVSWSRERVLSAGFFLPGILGLAHLLMTCCGMAFLLTAPGRHGVRASLITGLSFAGVHLLLVMFIASDFSDALERFPLTSGANSLVWLPVVSGLPATTSLATTMVNAKTVSTIEILLVAMGFVEAGRVVCTLFAARGLSTVCRSPGGRAMSLSAIITIGSVIFAVNLAVLSAVQHIQSATAGGVADAKYLDRVLMWTVIAVYAATTALALLYGLSVTFTHLAFKRANRAGWL